MSTRTPFTQEVRSSFVNYHLGDKEEIAQAFDRWLAEHDRKVELKGRRAGLQEAADIIGGEDPSGGMVSVTYLIRELYELINEPQPADKESE